MLVTDIAGPCTANSIRSDPLDVQLCIMLCVIMCCIDLIIVLSCSVLESVAAQQGRFPWEEAVKGAYKHLAGENGASDITRPRAWDRNAPYGVCTSHTPRDSSRPHC
jgi:hypothetical protein